MGCQGSASAVLATAVPCSARHVMTTLLLGAGEEPQVLQIRKLETKSSILSSQ